MPDLQIGDNAPDFKLPASGDQDIALSDYKGKKLILYFYPKDDTPGCTTEACNFRDNLPDLAKLNVAVLGASKDSVAKHEKFAAKYELPFPLLSDEDGTLCEDYGVWVEKNMYGRKYMGIERTTFLIDENGKIEQIWRKVKVKDHIKDINEALNNKKAA